EISFMPHPALRAALSLQERELLLKQLLDRRPAKYDKSTNAENRSIRDSKAGNSGDDHTENSRPPLLQALCRQKLQKRDGHHRQREYCSKNSKQLSDRLKKFNGRAGLTRFLRQVGKHRKPQEGIEESE